jgi:8-oxo-dGTP pyrophosphatase MutT (NUDIX family)
MTADDASKPARAEWVTHGSRSLYSSRWLDLQLVDVTSPDGKRFEHHVVRMQRVAAVVVLDDSEEHVLMLRRHRFIDDSWGWEVPVGIVEPGEDAAAAASREVEEETGWRVSTLERLLKYQPVLGIADTPHEVFIAHGSTQIGTPTDLTEAADVAWIPVGELLAKINAGEIRDGASLVPLLYWLASRGSA